jgi:hypothetical protein
MKAQKLVKQYKKNKIKLELLKKRIANQHKKTDSTIMKMEYKQDKLLDIINEVEQIISYLCLCQKKGETKIDIDVENIEEHIRQHDNGKYLEWLDYLYNDDFLKIRFLAGKNNKPENKYRLYCFGKCFFEKDFLRPPIIRNHLAGYFSDSNGESNCIIRAAIKDFDSIDKLKQWVRQWINKNGKKIPGLRDYIGDYIWTKNEYLDTIKEYKLEDFQEIWQPNKIKIKKKLISSRR